MLDKIREKFNLLECRNDNSETKAKNEEILLNTIKVKIIEQGIIEFLPKTHTPTTNIIISCGLHGDELNPVDYCKKLVNAILDGEINLQVNLQIHLGNLDALKQNTRFVQENINRLFDKNIQRNNKEAMRAKLLMQTTEDFFNPTANNLHLDLHASIRESNYCKFAIYQEQTERLSADNLELLSNCGLDALIISNKNTKTYTNHTAKIGYQAITIELGHIGQTDLDLCKFAEGIKNLLENQAINNQEQSNIKIFTVSREIIKDSHSFKLNFNNNIKNFTKFCRDEIIAYSHQPIFIESQEELVIFPNQEVKIGERAAILIKPIEKNNGYN